jgi:glycosyltransferase involved in cell wall biosynthesis
VSRNHLVSIITPTYARERFIRDCIQSVLNQTVSEWEMIILDDGSPDETEKVVRGFADDRIRYLRQEHVGPFRMAETYNRCLDVATGEFVAILEDDDRWPADKLANQLAFLDERPEVTMVYGRAQLVTEEGLSLGFNNLPTVPTARWNSISTADLLLRRASILPVTAIIRRSALLEIGGFRSFPDFPAVDYPTWLALSEVGPFAFRNRLSGYWRQHRGQETQKNPINVAARAVALAYYDSLPDERRVHLGISRRQIEHVHNRFVTDAHWGAALRHCAMGQWTEARNCLRQVHEVGNVFRRLEATVALPLTYLHVDVAALLRLVTGSKTEGDHA